MISISGISKAKVLVALFNASRQQGMGILDTQGASDLSLHEAEEITNEQLSFNYLRGRIMKVDISKDTFDPWLYDRDNGDGAAKKAIDSIK